MAKRDPNHLTPEKDGRFCKRVRGVLYHFGRDGDRDLALREWLAAKDDLVAGRKVRRRVAAMNGAVTIRSVRDRFLTACTVKVNDAKMQAGTYDDYSIAVDEFGEAVGWGRDPSDLAPDDFTGIRRTWAGRFGPWALDRHVQAVRTMFNWAEKFRLISSQPFYGDSFGKSTERDKRTNDRERARSRGERAFTRLELSVILEAVTGQLRAMVMLALNGGMYSKDVAGLRFHHIRNEDGEWIVDYDRNKTDGVPWKFPLWPETKAAIDAARRARNKIKAAEPADKDRLFLTIFGRPFHREHVERAGEVIESASNIDLIAQEFDKVVENIWILEDAGRWKWRALKREGLGFGSFRHTHITAVGDHPEADKAGNRVTGHKVLGVKGRHYDKIPVSRLKSVTDLARQRLLIDAPVASGSPAAPVPIPG